MNKNVNDFLADAEAAVPRISPQAARQRVADRDRTVILYCAAGGRSPLAGLTLKTMGYESVFNLGLFQDWIDSGGATAIA